MALDDGQGHAVSRRARWLGWAALLAAFLWSAWATEVSLTRVVEGVPFMLDFVRRMVPPDWSVIGNAVRGAVQTVEIALVGTAVAAVVALPMGFATARNAAPPWLFHGARVVLNALRAIDTLVYALFFVAAVGLGPFPGVLAVIAYTATVLAKLYSEAIEAIDPGPVEAVRATGARPLQVLRWGVAPQLLPQFLSFTLYRWDINVRMSTIIGFVGGGGIGFILTQYINLLQWNAAGTAIWLIAIVVMAMDYASAVIRERIV